jgi:protein-tyrosine-phosphatase
MTSSRRQFKLRIWGLALGYFAFYLPYSVLIKLLTTKLWPGIQTQVSGFRLLPGVLISTVLVMLVVVSIKGWWKFIGRRNVFGRSIPCPGGLVILSGLGTALIIATTTLAFTFSGVSILFALVLMRGGVLMIAPAVDLLFGRRVRWFSWIALVLAIAAVLLAIANVDRIEMKFVVAAVIGLYLTGYLFRLPCVTRLAKTEDPTITRRYFVDEVTIALVFLIVIPVVLALIGKGEFLLELRYGFTHLFTSNIALPSFLIGGLYACLYWFGTLIYLDCRENTFCIPLNRGSSLLAGVVGSFLLFFAFNQPAPNEVQLAGAGMIVVALLFLSPLHHPIRTYERVHVALGRSYAALLAMVFRRLQPAAQLSQRQRLFLFVCSGNTCRSPMAAAMTNAEIAFRLKIPFAELETVNIQAVSAGLTARPGMPMTAEAQQTLRSLDVPVGPHASRNLTVELGEQAEMIFCMTSAHRKAVIEMLPSVASKTYCLDSAGDVEDPMGKSFEAYVNCALRIRSCIRLRFNELGLV